MTAIKTRIWQGGLAGITGDPAHEKFSSSSSPANSDVIALDAEAAPARETARFDGAALALEERQQTRVSPLRDALLHELEDDSAAPSESALADDRSFSETANGAELAARDTQQEADRGTTRMLGWWEVRAARSQESRELAATRIMPIEALLGRVSPAPGDSLQAKPATATARAALRAADVAVELGDREHAPTRPATASSPRLRIGLMLAMCAVAAYLCVVPAGGMAPAPAPAHASSEPSTRASLPTATPGTAAPRPASRAAAITQSASSASAASPAARPLLRARTPGHERAAIDALVAGDYPRAHQLYSELAESTPGPSAFSEAARILSERVRVPAAHAAQTER